MPHDTGLIANITLGFAFAFVGGFFAARIGLPPLVGYLLAGIAVGPHTPGFIADREIASQLADIGVALLMFGVGIHFSLRDLLAVRTIALPGAIGQAALVTALGAGVAFAWGWDLGAGLVLGLALAVASTVVMVRALMDRDLLESTHGQVAVGWLIVEDLLTVLVLVLLPALAVALGDTRPDRLAAITGESLLLALGLAVAKVAAFALLALLVGMRVVPWLLGQVARTGSRELFTLAVLALALGIAFGSAALFDVPLALGAFLAGLVLSESDLSHQVAAEALPLRDAFAVLFFVSVGMLFDPALLLSAPEHLLAVLAVVVLGKPLVVLLLVLAFGYPVRTALILAAGRAQIGEFSFILAELGHMVGLMPTEGSHLIMAAALLSITVNPFLFRLVDPVEAWLRRRPELAALLERRGRQLRKLPSQTGDGKLRGHAVLCGYGQVGQIISGVLERRGFTQVVIEQDRHTIEALRGRGMLALYGDAASPMLLRHVNLARARLLIIAIPDPLATRQIVDFARSSNPRLDIVARTHSEKEWSYLRAGRVTEAVFGERELAIEMVSFALRRFGVSSSEILAIVQGLRGRS